jgi:hypothetical protein
MTDIAQRVELPADLAEEVLDSGDAVEPFKHRSGGVAHAMQLVLDGVNTGADVVTLIVTAASCTRLAQALLRRRRNGGRPDRLDLRIVDGEVVQTLEINFDDPDAEARAAEFLLRALAARH